MYCRDILEITLNGSAVIRTVFSGTSGEVEGLSYDWLSHNLYWSDTLYSAIKMVATHSKTSKMKTILHTTRSQPTSIVVYPQQGYVESLYNIIVSDYKIRQCKSLCSCYNNKYSYIFVLSFSKLSKQC